MRRQIGGFTDRSVTFNLCTDAAIRSSCSAVCIAHTVDGIA
jgi:hypothetical protein